MTILIVETITARNDGIDMLRGFCILSVILVHCFIHMPLAHTLLPTEIFNIIFRSGYYGVMIFFVISGFLITSISLRRWRSLSKIQCGQFYKMRFARIMPCLLALLIISSLLNYLGVTHFVIHTTTLGNAFFSALTFHLNWLEAKTGYLPGNWDILWSLSVEEMFYLFFPIICLIFRKNSYLIFVMLFFIVVGPIARTNISNDIWSDHSYLSCIDGIAIGVLSGLFANRFTLNKKLFRLMLVIGLSLFAFIFLFRKEAYDLGVSKIGLNVTILEIGIGLILICMNEWYGKGQRNGSLQLASLRWFGRNSYEIYLTHSFFVLITATVLFNAAQSIIVMLSEYLLAILLSGICGSLVANYFSEPLNTLLRRKKVERNFDLYLSNEQVQ